jgi:hypothetical protein
VALLVRAFIIEEINGWDKTALHDYLRANLALRRANPPERLALVALETVLLDVKRQDGDAS